jgi:formylglycine-generating enzyme required for sulfatase activity
METTNKTRTRFALFGIIALIAVIGFIFASCVSFGDWSSSGAKGPVVEMVQIKGGIFTMGSPENERYRLPNSDETQHRVTLTDFSMGKYPVTQKQYETVMGMNPSSFKNPNSPEKSTENRPVNGVSWFDAVEFCNKLSEREGLTPVYTITGRTPEAGHPITAATVTADWDANGYRLPTEAQWEYACRAGSRTAYYSGADIGVNDGWYGSNSNNRTYTIGEKQANLWGLYDMYGNVQEWCWDWYGEYKSGPLTDPTGPDSGEKRVARGGYFGSNYMHLRSAFRGFAQVPYDSETINNFGFRVVAPFQEQPPSISWMPTISIIFELSHDAGNGRAAQKPVMFWFYGDTRTSVTVPWGQTLEIPVKVEYGQQNTRIDAEFEDDGLGAAFIVLDQIDPNQPTRITYRNSGDRAALVLQQ